MISRGEQHVSQLRDKLVCPGCGYSLRGLPGDLVCCPECGMSCDLVAMMTRRWTRRWYEAPGFNRLLWPVGWLMIAGMFVFAVFIVEHERERPYVVTSAAAALVLGVWILLLRHVRNTPSAGQGLRLAILAHVLTVGYVAGVAMTIYLLVGAGASGSFTVRVIFLVLTPVPVLGLWVARRGERHIASECIKAWLNRTD